MSRVKTTEIYTRYMHFQGFFVPKNAFAPLGSFQHSPRPPSWWGEALSPPQEHCPCFWLSASTFGASSLTPPLLTSISGYAYDHKVHERLKSSMGNPSQSYGLPPAIRDHTVLPATRHWWTDPTLTPAIQTGTLFTYPRGMEGWVDLGVGYIPRWFTCPQTVAHPSSNHLIATRSGVEPMTSRSSDILLLRHQATKKLIQGQNRCIKWHRLACYLQCKYRLQVMTPRSPFPIGDGDQGHSNTIVVTWGLHWNPYQMAPHSM